MDMKKILTNLDDAASGKKPAQASGDKNSMKSILESLQQVGEAHMPMGKPPMSMPPAMPPKDDGDPVSMNVSLNARGKEHVEDLMDIVKKANIDGEPEMDMPAGNMRMDMEKFRDIVDGPKPSMDMDIEGGCGEDVDEADYANEPDEQYKDTKFMTKDLAGGLNREKPRKALRVKDPALEDIKAQLWAALNEKKAKPDFLDMDKDGNKKEPMKKAIKDKESKKKNEAVEGVCEDCGNPSWKTLPEEKQKGVDGKVCWKGYKRMGTKKKGGKTVDNCVKM